MRSVARDLKKEELFLKAIIAREEALLEMDLVSVNEVRRILDVLSVSLCCIHVSHFTFLCEPGEGTLVDVITRGKRSGT